ncbi:protocatechuate 3,4-dioxygenase subunit alpha [Pontivivens ytuae]|uniref:Protocatechuate 3,4-dioxygenase subunit alpha n=1 Tax=Pontivivens ytuae TaxID=2789856 RepID=A0A7S9QCB2_9RHOB|nr:protocatechuate 3,4-dioxygenase subunit alpha [Pontivivens ytuae]QPH53645.1 protocatechuate 3,4-dioxygenase subunit alpha [Pontivivens ytuae]
MPKESASQTAGPYVHIGCVPSFAGLKGRGPDLGAAMVTDATRGERITVEGYVYDGAGAPLRDALLEIWQADADGLYASPAETRGTADPVFTGWGRQPTDGETGLYRFETIKPGRVPWPDGRMQAPHLSLWLVARGINLGLATRIYFADEAEANAGDPLLARIDPPSRVRTLVAERQGDTYCFNIHLQGPGETVFLDV